VDARIVGACCSPRADTPRYIATFSGVLRAPAQATSIRSAMWKHTPPSYARVAGDRVIETASPPVHDHTPAAESSEPEESGPKRFATATGTSSLAHRRRRLQQIAEGKLAPWPGSREDSCRQKGDCARCAAASITLIWKKASRFRQQGKSSSGFGALFLVLFLWQALPTRGAPGVGGEPSAGKANRPVGRSDRPSRGGRRGAQGVDNPLLTGGRVVAAGRQRSTRSTVFSFTCVRFRTCCGDYKKVTKHSVTFIPHGHRLRRRM